MNTTESARLFARITIARRDHPRRPFEAFVDGKSILTFATLGAAGEWVRDQGAVELLRTDLAAHFAALGSSDFAISGVCWSTPDSWVMAAAWLAEADPTMLPAAIGRRLMFLSYEAGAHRNV